MNTMTRMSGVLPMLNNTKKERTHITFFIHKKVRKLKASIPVNKLLFASIVLLNSMDLFSNTTNAVTT